MCAVGREQSNMTNDWVTQKLDLPMRRLGVKKLDLVQMYWNDYGQKAVSYTHLTLPTKA